MSLRKIPICQLYKHKCGHLCTENFIASSCYCNSHIISSDVLSPTCRCWSCLCFFLPLPRLALSLPVLLIYQLKGFHFYTFFHLYIFILLQFLNFANIFIVPPLFPLLSGGFICFFEVSSAENTVDPWTTLPWGAPALGTVEALCATSNSPVSGTQVSPPWSSDH